jgi:hypothetical protein
MGGRGSRSWETALFAHNLFDKLGEIGDLQPEGAQLSRPAALLRHTAAHHRHS